MNKQIFNTLRNLRFVLCIFQLLVFGSFTTFANSTEFITGDTDLEISFSTTNPNPDQWSEVPLTVTIFNNSDEEARDVVIKMSGCPFGSGAVSGLFVQDFGYVYANTDTPATLGSYDWLDQIWTIPVIEAGATGQLNFTLYALVEEERNLVAELIEAKPDDIDSAPANMTTCDVVEDDEAILSFNSTAQNNCEIKTTISNVQCDDNGTDQDFSDDTYSFDLKVEGTSTGTNWNIAGTNISGTYDGQLINMGPFAAADGVQTFIVRDQDIPTCSDAFTIDPADACLTSGTIDLELDLVQSVNNPQQWSKYSVLATLSNVGDLSATEVVVDLAKADNVVYVGSDPYTISEGTFNPNGSELWEIEEIAPGESVTLEVNYFLKTSGSPITYAQVLSVNEADLDSTPGNGSRPIAYEDDEAATYEGSGNDPADLTLANLSINNDPVEAGQTLYYTFDISNIGGTSVDEDFKVKAWISTDKIISADDIQNGTVQTGNFGKGLTVTDVLGASRIFADVPAGEYYLILKVDADEEIQEGVEDNNEIFAMFTVENEDGIPCNDIFVDVGPGSLTIANTNAPHILKKVYTLNWNTVLVCLDDECEDPSIVSGLAGGRYLVDIKLIDDNWNTICDFEEYYDVPSGFIATGPSSFEVRERPSRSVVLKSIRPNPIYFGKTELVIFCKEEGRQELQCYSTLGRLETTYQVNLQEGMNIIPLDVSELAGGTYFLHMPGQNWRQMPVKFVVVRD